jgi:hypothetical protein
VHAVLDATKKSSAVCITGPSGMGKTQASHSLVFVVARLLVLNLKVLILAPITAFCSCAVARCSVRVAAP